MHTKKLTLKFHAVGQGLFASGELLYASYKPGFRWVYDCGTSSGKDLVTKAINDLKHSTGSTKPTLDLVTISHFDRDHISGIVALLKSFSVETLLLPYIPLWQRLVVALDNHASADQELMRFLINPVAYLTEQDGTSIKQIVFVPSIGRNDRAPETTFTEREVDNVPSLHVPQDDVLEPEMRQEIEPFQQQSQIKIIVLKRGQRLKWDTDWEFVPYNDSKVSCKNPSAFRQKVAELHKKLISSPSETAIQLIKKEYDDAFGKSSKSRNIISLFLYAGPMRIKKRPGYHAVAYERGPGQRRREFLLRPDRASVIYTGDGYLNTTSRIQRFRNFLGLDRIQHTLCLQVMHHGSKNNWQTRLADMFKPSFSVFSSDPTHRLLHHPDAEVLHDFWPYNPIQVDKHRDILIHCWF